jgi:hypothetical protein
MRISTLGVVLATVILAIPARAEDAFPARLSGRWSSVDGKYTDMVFLISDSPDKGVLTVSSGIAQCTISGAPVSIKKQEGLWVLVVDPLYSNPCRKDVSLTLKQTAAGTYEGELRQQTVNGSFPTLNVKLSP